jgi:septal ring factor EnvC (AmiA/AmiB activator)
MKTRTEKVEEALNRFNDATDRTNKKLEKLEHQLRNLDTDSTRNKIIIWVTAAILAAIIIAFRS